MPDNKTDHLREHPGPAPPRRRAVGIEAARVCFVIGIMLLVLTVFMLPPAVTDIIAGHTDWQVFASSGFVTGFLGLMLVMINRGNWSSEVSLREGFVLTVSSWVVLSAVAAIPFIFLGRGLSLIDAWFEAVSGLTTTGSTVLGGLDELPPGILLWRSLIQWIGGIGIVVMALIMLPFLGVGGMQLFHTESSDRADKFVARARELMSLIALTYVVLTLLCAIAYRLAGMTGFDALNHAMTTVATGGFSTHDKSFGFFEQDAVHWVAIAFMFASSLPLALYVKMAKTGSLDLFRDAQVRGFTAMVLITVIGMAAWYALRTEIPFGQAVRTVAFNTVSIMSTAGYSSSDYTAWGAGAFGTFFVLMFLGGCTGSTTGGMKMFRLQVMLVTARNYIAQLMSPNRIVVTSYQGKQITRNISTSVLAYVSVLFASVMLFTVVLSFFGLDFVTSLSGAATALCNVGPGLGSIIGPAGNFGPLPDGAKVVLVAGMLLGRLEFFTVLVIMHRDFWR